MPLPLPLPGDSGFVGLFDRRFGLEPPALPLKYLVVQPSARRHLIGRGMPRSHTRAGKIHQRMATYIADEGFLADEDIYFFKLCVCVWIS